MYGQFSDTPEYKHIKLRQEGRTMVVTLHRPDSRNALNRELMLELENFAFRYASSPSIDCVILSGGSDYFSSGADLSEDAGHVPEDDKLLNRREYNRLGPGMCQSWERMDMVTIAAIEGFAVGGAVALACSCDFRIMGKSSKAKLPEIPLGINMSWRSIPRITSLIGPARAKQFVIFGEWLEAKQAEVWGFADSVVDDSQTLAQALKMAKKIEKLPPLPVRMTKEAVDNYAFALQNTASFMDRDQYILTATSKDFAEGVRSHWKKTPPNFQGD